MNCAICYYSTPEIVDFDAAGAETPTPILLCRRYPPTMVGTGEVDPISGTTQAGMAFPQVTDRDWCGEWKGQHA